MKKSVILDIIEDLKSCVKDEENKTNEPYLSDYEKGFIYGKIDGYEKSIELLEFALKVFKK